jgi:site-specific recombinase XerD
LLLDDRVRLPVEATMTKWTSKWNTWIAPKPIKPGVWRRKEGGFLVRGRVKDPRTGKLKQVRFNVMDTSDPNEALERLTAAMRAIREGTTQESQPSKRFAEFAVELLEEKVKEGKIASAGSRVKVASILECHLIPAFGEMYMDQIRHIDIVTWRKGVADKIHDQAYAPTTANSWLGLLRVTFKAATQRFELDRNPMDGIENFDTRLHHTYTEEEPNSLLAHEVPTFLAKMRELYPEFFAMVALGFATGWRPSTLRPIRRQGPRADVLWEQGQILVRRSHTEFKEVMEGPKNKRHQRVSLPEEIMSILRWHADRLPEGPMRESELLFPNPEGDFLDRSCLRKPFDDVNKALELKKRITPKAMRRTFQDLARAANVNDLVTRSVSGHATEAMQRHYSTVNQDEQREGLARVVSLFELEEPSGLHGGLHGHKSKKAG